MNLDTLEILIHWMGGLLAFTALGVILYGVWRGSQRQVGRITGHAGTWLRSWWFYLGSSIFFFGIAYIGWTPLPLTISQQIRTWMLVVGVPLYFAGMALVLWGRLALGTNYFVSTGFGAQLFADHQLITCGPFAIVRHPMYTGIFFAAIGSLLIYFTWTTLYFAGFAPLMFIRAWREEQVLAAEFGEQWQVYCQRTGMFFPKFFSARQK